MGRRAGLSAGASCFASSAFGAFPLFYTVLLSAVNINDILALTFVFLALLALENPTRARIAAGVGSLVLALLSKEAVVFVPFAAVLLPLPGERLSGTVRRLAPLLVMGAVFAGLYLAFRKHGLGTGGYAYAMGFGVNLFHNLMTYAWWSIDLVRAVPDEGMPDPSAWRVGIWPLAILALGAVFSRSRRAAILFGCAWWLLGLLPVLPLLAHSYGHYLYVPMAGLAVAGAATLDSLVEGLARLLKRGQPGPRLRVVAATGFIVLALGLAARSELLLRQRVSTRLGKSELALDPFTRKMEVARTAVSTLTGQLDRGHDSVVVFIPPGLGKPISARTGQEVEAVPAGVPSYDVAAGVLGGGLALRLFDSRLDSVVFADRWSPAYRNFNLFVEGPRGQMMKIGRGPQSHSRFGGALLNGGYHAQARDYIGAVVQTYPRDRLLRLLYAATLSVTGEPDSARANALRVIEWAPPDTLTATARMMIGIIDRRK
jgi:hypothetical protein